MIDDSELGEVRSIKRKWEQARHEREQENREKEKTKPKKMKNKGEKLFEKILKKTSKFYEERWRE